MVCFRSQNVFPFLPCCGRRTLNRTPPGMSISKRWTLRCLPTTAPSGETLIEVLYILSPSLSGIEPPTMKIFCSAATCCNMATELPSIAWSSVVPTSGTGSAYSLRRNHAKRSNRVRGGPKHEKPHDRRRVNFPNDLRKALRIVRTVEALRQHCETYSTRPCCDQRFPRMTEVSGFIRSHRHLQQRNLKRRRRCRCRKHRSHSTRTNERTPIVFQATKQQSTPHTRPRKPTHRPLCNNRETKSGNAHQTLYSLPPEEKRTPFPPPQNQSPINPAASSQLTISTSSPRDQFQEKNSLSNTRHHESRCIETGDDLKRSGKEKPGERY